MKSSVAACVWTLVALVLAPACAPSPEHSAASRGASESANRGAPCLNAAPGQKQIYWGDLHVHTAWSLDAYGYGTVRSPAEAYAFAKGEPFDDGRIQAKLARPLDFMAVTDHAEWLDLMHICTDPGFSSAAYCARLRQISKPATGAEVFKDYVNPTITGPQPAPPGICKSDPAACTAALASQWTRLQAAANDANVPCEFTAFIGYEWSATPNYSHTHRNVIFSGARGSDQAIDYIRHPTLGQLFDQLDAQCRIDEGCEAITIPHNTNFGDGNSFDVETDVERVLEQRGRYERLIEISQEKGTSECLPAFADRAKPGDCDFEPYIVQRSRPKPLDQYSEGEWERMRSSYVRGLLRRGLEAAEKNQARNNPLQLGLIGSTDTHTGMGGLTEEDAWEGSVFGFGNFEASMSRLGFGPGGLAAVWAEENTREALFDALKRREVYATSGPRIGVRFHAAEKGLSCSAGGALAPVSAGVAMGSTLRGAMDRPQLRIAVSADRTPLARIEIVRGVLKKGAYAEDVVPVWASETGEREACVVWTDDTFDPAMTAYWYARILEQPSRRWSSYACEAAGRCDEFPGADVQIQERAWASPIWYVPG